MAANLNGVEELEDVCLAVVCDEIVCWLSFSDALDDGFAWKKSQYERRNEVDEILTSSSQCIIVESRLADFESAPLISIDLCIRINNIEILILRNDKLFFISSDSWVNSPSTADERTRQPEQPNVASDRDTY